MKYCLSFDDVLITPKFSDINSRSEVTVASKLGDYNLELPVISANMDTITGSEMATTMWQNGAIGALHRFQSINDNVQMFLECNGNPVICSIGVNNSELERFIALQTVGARLFLIDVANAASLKCVEFFKKVRELAKPDTKFIIGNFATRDSVLEFFQRSGNTSMIAAIKVGIGSGSLCETRIVTGAGWPTLQSLIDCSSLQIPLIGCGGFKNSGDIAKALAVPNVVAVMLGGMLAATDETPGEEIVKDAGLYRSAVSHGDDILAKSVVYKAYRGSASLESYKVQGKEASYRSPEGESTWIPCKGPVKAILEQINGGLRSAFSYVNASNLEQFKDNVDFVQVSVNGFNESKAHGKK